MKKRLFIIGYILSIVWFFCSGCASQGSTHAVGYFEAEEVTVSAEATGRLLEFALQEGQQVTAGVSVGAVDSTQLYLNKLQLQKNVKSVVSNRPDVNVQLAALEAQLAHQRAEKIRVEQLVAARAVPSKQLDDINSAVAQLERQLEAQKKTLQGSVGSIDAQSSAIDIQIALVEDQLSKCRLCAPVSGTVLATYVSAGEFAVAGKPMYKVARLEEMTLRAYVTSDYLASLQIGLSVRVTAVFGGDNRREYEGTVAWIADKSEFTPKNIPTDEERSDMVYAVKIRVKNDGYIKIGTFGEVAF